MRVFSIRVSYKRAMPKPTHSSQNNAVRTDSSELLRSLSRKFKKVTGANRNSCQPAQINEALGWKGYFFDGDQPFSDPVEHQIVQSTLRLPGRKAVSSIVTQKRRTGRLCEIAPGAFESVGSGGESIGGRLSDIAARLEIRRRSNLLRRP